MCAEPPRPLTASAALNCALDVVGADLRWQRLHSPLGEVVNLAHAVFLHPAAGWFFPDHQQVQLAVVAQLRDTAPDPLARSRPAQPQEATGGLFDVDAAADSGQAPDPHQHPRALTAERGRRRSVVDELRTRSPHFHRLWSGLHVRYRVRTSYAVHHPDLGQITLERFVARAAGEGWHERIEAPQGSRAAQAMTLLDLV